MVDVKLALQEIKEDSESGNPTAVAIPRKRRYDRLIAALAGMVLLAAIAGWRWWPRGVANAPLARVVPLTTLRGHELWPTFSPDGNQVAFAWSGEKDDNPDIYVKFVGASELRRLTSGPQNDTAPSWSPDGRQIAYIHDARPGDNVGRIHLLSALGGSDLKLSDLLMAAPLHGLLTAAFSPRGTCRPPPLGANLAST